MRKLSRVFVVVLFLAAGCASNGPRDVLVVAHGMTFTLPSDDTPNPVIRVEPGEQIRVTFRNDAPGLIHDFRIPAWNLKTDQIRGGESTTVVFTVPSTEGRYEYKCGPHAAMMHGFIEVKGS